jgi:thiol:disulfide interchange protein DsbC
MNSKNYHTALLIILLVMFSGIALSEDVGLQKIREIVTEMSSDIKEEQVISSPVDGWYIIKKGAYVAYISEDGRHLIQGDMYNLETQTNLSEKIRNDSRKDVIATYPSEQMIVFKPNKKLHSVTVFTDIDCTFCRRLHNQIDDYLDAGIEIRYLLYPRSGPKSPSWAIAERVWCSDDRNNALTMAKIDQQLESRDCDSSAISAHFMLGQDIGLQGTPAIVLEDGSMVNGYVSALELSKIISPNN